MLSLTGAFSSLGINERASLKENSSGKKFPKNRSTISLPNMVLSERPTVSLKFIRRVCDDEGEQPVDFSKKYGETKLDKKDNKERGCTFNNVVKSYNKSFTMYAETDLDQPTDYSLRYAEDDSDSDRCNKIPKTEATEFVQDTLKTYCTEDTPYETPFNFSTSTSMSDLRIDDKAPDNKMNNSDPKSANVTVINTKEVTNTGGRKIKSEFSSGLMSPEKPVNYCEEGTPGYFSRVPSCGSLNSIPVNDPPKQKLKEETLENVEDAKKELRKASKYPPETKAVKFEEVVNYAETPLMFSRSSSLVSLDSFEQHSIQDDRSSVVSDFSRLTSGVISPSELPDSPSQTVPPSPRPRKTLMIFPTPPKKETEETPKTVQNVPKCSVFEDVVKKFKIETTPLQFSSATSLSSLIDDEVDGKVGNNESEEGVHVKGEENDLDLNNDLSESSEDEDILAACINFGMQSNRYSQPKSKSPPPTTAPPAYKYSPEISNLNSSRITLSSGPQHLSVTVSQNDSLQKTDVTCDSLRTYCTEGTPALLSHAGSNSDLSTLSMPCNEKAASKDTLEAEKRDLCDLSRMTDIHNEQEELPLVELKPACDGSSRRSSFSCLSVASHESDDALLEECILAGMHKSSSKSSKLSSLAGPSGAAAQNNLNLKNGNDSDFSDDEDTDILENCIKFGIESNRYTQSKLNSNPSEFKTPNAPPSSTNDTVTRYYTEDTPATLSHAGSISNLSVLSMNGTENGTTNYLSDLNSNFSDDDDDDDKLLEECVKYGMAAICGKVASNNNSKQTTRKHTEDLKVDNGRKMKASPRRDSISPSSFSDDSNETDHLLLQQCIKAGMPKRTKPPQNDSSDLTTTEKALLQQCILEGMKKCRTVPAKPPEDDISELTEAEQALLRQCILAGMPKNKNLSQGGPSRSRESTELTESERLLLQQCILAGMPKSRSKTSKENVGSRQLKKPKEVDKNSAEHTCCVHCPRNKTRTNGHVKGKRKHKEKGLGQLRENRDVNIVYVTSQVLTVKKEVVHRTHDNWV